MDFSLLTDTQAEAGVIATLLYHPEFILHTDYLKSRYFYNVENGCIYWAISELYKKGIDNIDAMNLTTMLNSNTAVKKKIDEYNLSDIQNFINISKYAARHTIEEYKLLVDQVVTNSFKRDLAKVSLEIQTDCFNSSFDLSKLNHTVNDKLKELTENYIITHDVELFGDRVDDLLQEILDRKKNGSAGFPSKFPSLNEYFTYEKGELVLLKARMKKGKSAWFMNEAIHKIQSGVPTLYFDTEMKDRLFYERMISNLTGIKMNRMKYGDLSDEEVATMRKTNEWIKKQPFVHLYIPTVTDDEIYAICKILKYKMDLQFVVYDYIKSDVASTSENYNILGQKTDFLKNRVGGELDLAVLAGAQLSRSNMVADSDKLERYVTASIMWDKKTPQELSRDGIACGNYKMTVNLNRLGAQMEDDDYIDMDFDGNCMRINECANRHPDTPFDE